MIVFAFSLLFVAVAGESEPAYQIGTNSDPSGGHNCSMNYCTATNNDQQNNCYARWWVDFDAVSPWGSCTSAVFIPGPCTTDSRGCTVQESDGTCDYECHTGTERAQTWATEQWVWVMAHIPHM